MSERYKIRPKEEDPDPDEDTYGSTTRIIAPSESVITSPLEDIFAEKTSIIKIDPSHSHGHGPHQHNQNHPGDAQDQAPAPARTRGQVLRPTLGRSNSSSEQLPPLRHSRSEFGHQAEELRESPHGDEGAEHEEKWGHEPAKPLQVFASRMGEIFSDFRDSFTVSPRVLVIVGIVLVVGFVMYFIAQGNSGNNAQVVVRNKSGHAAKTPVADPTMAGSAENPSHAAPQPALSGQAMSSTDAVLGELDAAVRKTQDQIR